MSFPLLEEIDLAELDPQPVEEEEPQRAPSPPPDLPEEGKTSSSLDKKSISSTKDKKSKASSKSTKSKKAGKPKEPGPYDAPDEHEREARLHLRNASFKTERIAWAKTMQFPEDAVVVETSESDLVKVRDTFRSCVEVKVVYLKVKG